MGKKSCLSRYAVSSEIQGDVRFRESHAELALGQRCSLSLDDLAFIAATDATVKKKKERWLKENKRKTEKDYKGETFDHPLASDSRGLLYEAIHDMVYKLALGYSPTCKEDVDDLAQDCMSRIMERIGDFKPELAKFTTWSWRVCISVLNRAYRRESARNQHILSVDISEIKGKHEPRAEVDSVSTLRGDLASVIGELMKRYPSEKRFLEEMLKVLAREGFFSMRATIETAASRAGISYFVASRFFDRIVRPFFKKSFCIA